jgi:hypothetical protein
MMTNQLNIKQELIRPKTKELVQRPESPTRPGDEKQQNSPFETTACGLKVVEMPDDEELEF